LTFIVTSAAAAAARRRRPADDDDAPTRRLARRPAKGTIFMQHNGDASLATLTAVAIGNNAFPKRVAYFASAVTWRRR
jgi:hypothetical protein